MPKIFDFHIHASNDTPAADILSFLDSIGAERGAVLATDHGAMGEARGTQVLNRSVARMAAESRGRLVGIASVHPETAPSPAQALEKALDMGLSGLKLYPHSGFYPNTEALFETYELAQDRGIPVLCHTGIKAHPMQHMVYNDPLYLDEVAVKFPRLKLVIMHAGYPWVKNALMVSRLNENVWIDFTFLDVLEYTFREEGLLESTVKQFARVLGTDRLIWGSEGWDLGLPMFEDEGVARVQKCIGKLLSLDFLTDDEKEKILYGNACRLLP